MPPKVYFRKNLAICTNRVDPPPAENGVFIAENGIFAENGVFFLLKMSFLCRKNNTFLGPIFNGFFLNGKGGTPLPINGRTVP